MGNTFCPFISTKDKFITCGNRCELYLNSHCSFKIIAEQLEKSNKLQSKK